MKAEKHRMISLKCGKTRFFFEYNRSFVLDNEKYLNAIVPPKAAEVQSVFCRNNGEQGHMANC